MRSEGRIRYEYYVGEIWGMDITRAVTGGIGGYNWGYGYYEGGIGGTDITGLAIRGDWRVESGVRILRGESKYGY